MAGYWNEKRVMVTGATGFVGSWLAKTLIDQKAQLVVLSRDFLPDSMFNQPEIRNKVHAIVNGDITDYATVERTLNEHEVDTCFHIAAQAIVGVANKSPLSTFETNIKGTWNVLEACRRLDKKVIVASSDKAYGETTKLPYTEETSMNGLYPYDASKSCADILTRAYNKTYGLKTAVSRCANIYGGGDLNFSRIIPYVIKEVVHDRSPVLDQSRSSGKILREYLFVQDAADAYLALGENIDKIAGEAFNFGSGERASVNQLMQKIIDVSGKKLKITVKPGKMTAEISDQYLSTDKANKVLGWKAKYSLDQGLRKTYDWYSAFFARKNLNA